MIVGLPALRVTITALTVLAIITSTVVCVSEWRRVGAAAAITAAWFGLILTGALMIAAVAITVASNTHSRMERMQERMAIGDRERQQCLELLLMLQKAQECTSADLMELSSMYAAQLDMLGAAASALRDTGTESRTGTGPQPYLRPIR